MLSCTLHPSQASLQTASVYLKLDFQSILEQGSYNVVSSLLVAVVVFAVVAVAAAERTAVVVVVSDCQLGSVGFAWNKQMFH